MNQPVWILVADNHAIAREGIRLVLESEADLIVVGEACTGAAAIAFATDRRPTIVIMGITLPDVNGLAATIEIKRRSPEVQVMLLGLDDSDEYFFHALQAGASGYLPHASDRRSLVAAIRTVSSDTVFAPPSIQQRLGLRSRDEYISYGLREGIIGLASDNPDR